MDIVLFLGSRRGAIGDYDASAPSGNWIVWDETVELIDAGFQTFEEAAAFAYAQSVLHNTDVEFGKFYDCEQARALYRQWLTDKGLG